MQSLRYVRPLASRLQPTTLPRVSRSFSATARSNYEYIQVSEPKPGVGQGTMPSTPPLRRHVNGKWCMTAEQIII